MLVGIGMVAVPTGCSCDGPDKHAVLNGPGGEVDLLNADNTLIVTSNTGSVHMWQWEALDKVAEKRVITEEGFGAVCPNDQICLIIPSGLNEDGHYEHSPLLLWDTKEGKELKRWEIERAWYFNYLRPSQNGWYVVVGLAENYTITKNYDNPAARFAVLNVETQELTWLKATVSAKYGSLGAISISDDGAYIAVVGIPTAPSITVIDVKADKIAWQQKPEEEAGLRDVRFSPDGAVVYAAGTMSWVYTFDLGTGKEVKKWHADPTGKSRFGYRICSLAVSADGRFVAAGTGPYGHILVWDVVANKRVAFLRSGAGTTNDLIFSPDGSKLASRGCSTDIAIWKLPAPEAQ
ncbi:MAG: WD40 repeat domain-containing protein [Verrucomicrobia bacterium]|nr:WD40 repeat domain-containing protein [Verrucomicrobiota bacterium]